MNKKRKKMKAEMDFDTAKKLIQFALASVRVINMRNRLIYEKQFEEVKILKKELTEVNEEIRTLMEFFRQHSLILLASKNRLDGIEFEAIRNESINQHITRICKSHYEKPAL